MSGEVKVVLAAPIQAYGEEVTVLALRAPTGRDIRGCGYPFRISADGEEMSPQAQVVARYISALAKIPMGSVDQLSAPDFNSCMGAVMGFFGDSLGDSQGKTPATPETGERRAPGTESKTSPATSPPSSAATQAAS